MVNENFMKCAMHGAEKVEPFESHRLTPTFMWIFMLLGFFFVSFWLYVSRVICNLSFYFILFYLIMILPLCYDTMN